MYLRTIQILFLLLLIQSSKAQDIVNFTQFFFNPYNINPSFAGIDGRPSIALAYRKQWATIDGGPTVVNFSFQAPATKRLAMGLNVVQDTRGLLSNTGVTLSVAYGIPLAPQSFLRFGISGGASWNKVDMDKLEGFSDNAISKILNNNAYLLGNAGISVHVKSFHAGISLPILFAPAYVSQDAFSVTEVKPFQALVAHVSNRFYFNDDKYAFEPYLLYRVNTGLPSQLEVAGVLHLNHVLYVGGSYKQDFGISALGGIKLKNTFAVGASYSLRNTGINQLNSPTYEVHLGLLFGARKKEAPVYSFVDTQKVKQKKATGKSASEQIAEKRKQEELAKKKNDALAKKPAETTLKKRPPVSKDTAQPNKTVAVAAVTATKPPSTEVKPPPVDGASQAHRPRFDHADLTEELMNFDVTEHTPEDEKERISRLTLHAADPKEQHNNLGYPNAERHEFVAQGPHKQELSVANYVVGGVFTEPTDAAHFSDGLTKLGFKAGYGYSTEKSVWYVYVFKTNDINKAREERDQLRKTKILRDAWLLTVQR